MTRFWFAAVAALALVPSTHSPAHAQEGVVHGAVVDGATHVRIAGARVVVAGTDLTAVTGVDGSYRISGIPAGDHTIEATLPGYQRGVSGCVRVPTTGTAGIAVPMLREGYVPPPPPARDPAPPVPVRPDAQSRRARGPLLYLINGLLYPPDYGPEGPPALDSERLASVEVLHAGPAMQRFRPCVLVEGAILLEIDLPGESGRIAGTVLDATTAQPLTEVRIGALPSHRRSVRRNGRFGWFTRDSTTGLAVSRFGYRPYILPCQLRVPVDDSVNVLVRLSPMPASASEPGTPELGTLLQPLFVVDGTIWAPRTEAPLIPADEIAAVETLAPGPARERFGQCGAAGAVLVRRR